MADLKIENTGAQYIPAAKPCGGSAAPRAQKGTDLRRGSTRPSAKADAKRGK